MPCLLNNSLDLVELFPCFTQRLRSRLKRIPGTIYSKIKRLAFRGYLQTTYSVFDWNHCDFLSSQRWSLHWVIAQETATRHSIRPGYKIT